MEHCQTLEFSVYLVHVEPDVQVQGKFTLFGGARLFFLGGSSVKTVHCISIATFRYRSEFWTPLFPDTIDVFMA